MRSTWWNFGFQTPLLPLSSPLLIFLVGYIKKKKKGKWKEILNCFFVGAAHNQLRLREPPCSFVYCVRL